MERVVAIQIVAAVERTAQILAGTSCTEELLPVTGINGVECVSVTECEPQFTTTSQHIAEYGILEDVAVAVRELLALVVSPSTVATHEIVGVGNADSLYLEGLLHHVDGDADLLGTSLYTERVVGTQLGAASQLTLLGFVVTTHDTVELAPVVGDSFASLVITDSKPSVARSGSVEDNGEDRINVDILATVLKLNLLLRSIVPVVRTADDVVGGSDGQLVEWRERHSFLCVVVLARLTHDGLSLTTSHGVHDSTHVELRGVGVLGNLVEVGIFQHTRLDGDFLCLGHAVSLNDN